MAGVLKCKTFQENIEIFVLVVEMEVIEGSYPVSSIVPLTVHV